MLKLSQICLTNTIIFLSTLLLSKSFCCAFQISTTQQHSTNTLTWTTTLVDPQRTSSITLDQSCNGRLRSKMISLHAMKSESLMVNGSKSKTSVSFFEGMDVAALPEGGELSLTVEAESPPMSFDKFVTMQEKRAVVTIRYSGDAGLKPYFLTIAKKLKQSHPDIVIERRILPSVVDGNYEATFEVLVEGKVVIGKSRQRKISRNGNNDVHDIIGRRSVYVSMNELDLAISRARRKHRPTTVYGNGEIDTFLMNGKSKSNNKMDSTTGLKNTEKESGRIDWSD